MIRIGLVGEDPNDTSSVKNLLFEKYPRIRFEPIAKNIKGSKLGSKKLKSILLYEISKSNFTHIIFISDLDGLESHTDKVKAKRAWFKELNDLANDKGILLLNIYELEALILSDIKSFNKFFGTTLTFTSDPMKQINPKEYFKKKTANHRRKYRESDCPEIFAKLDIETVANNCKYFKEFLALLDAKLKKVA